MESLNDPDFFPEYYKAIISLFTNTDRYDIDDKRERLLFQQVADAFRIIDSPQKAVFIYKYDEEAQYLYEKIKKQKYPDKNDYRKIQQYSVQLYPRHFDEAERNGNIMLYEDCFYVWEGDYGEEGIMLDEKDMPNHGVF